MCVVRGKNSFNVRCFIFCACTLRLGHIRNFANCSNISEFFKHVERNLLRAFYVYVSECDEIYGNKINVMAKRFFSHILTTLLATPYILPFSCTRV